MLITGESVGFATSDITYIEGISLRDTLQWSEMVAEFLDQQQWKDHSISFMLPAEDVSFRKITFKLVLFTFFLALFIIEEGNRFF